MPNAHRLDGGIVDQGSHDALQSIVSKSTHIIAIGLVALHIGIGIGHACNRGDLNESVTVFLEDL